MPGVNSDKNLNQAPKTAADIQAEASQNKEPLKTELLQKLDNAGFLAIPQQNRLAYITKPSVKSEQIATGAVRNIEFSFTFGGKFNKALYQYTTLGQVLPDTVSQVQSGGKSYERNGVSGEFYESSSGERLRIKEQTKVDITQTRTPEQIQELDKQVGDKYKNYASTHKGFATDEYKPTICEIYRKGLDDKAVNLILLNSYSDDLPTDPKELDKILVVTRHLKNGGFLDGLSHGDTIISDLKEIIQTIKTYYGADVKYTMTPDGRIQVAGWEKGVPENLDPNALRRIQQIGLSQLSVTEQSGGANKYFSESGFGKLDATSTPWCGAFVNWTLQKAGYAGSGSLAAKSFIGEGGLGHVGIKVGEKTLGGNQGNKVALAHIRMPIAGYALPTPNGLEKHPGAISFQEIPDGAIVVYNRSVKNTNAA